MTSEWKQRIITWQSAPNNSIFWSGLMLVSAQHTSIHTLLTPSESCKSTLTCCRGISCQTEWTSTNALTFNQPLTPLPWSPTLERSTCPVLLQIYQPLSSRDHELSSCLYDDCIVTWNSVLCCNWSGVLIDVLVVLWQAKPRLQRGGSSASLHNSLMRNSIFQLMIHTLDPLSEGTTHNHTA